MFDFHNKTQTIVFRELNSGAGGLSQKEAENRLKKYGKNVLKKQKKISILYIFIDQFKSALIYILLFTGVLSLLIGAFKEAVVIFAAIIINVIVGFVQEKKANQALQKLKKMAQQSAIVIRDGGERIIPSHNLVPGDVISLRAGNRVPADARILTADTLHINESALTGESNPAKKKDCIVEKGVPLADRQNMLYAGTIVLHGEGKAIITASANNTEIGKIANLIEEITEAKTPLQLRLEEFSRILGGMIIVLCLLIVIAGVSQNRPFLEILETAVAVGVASIPEGLAVAITFILALGMKKILKRKALIRKLLAAETLGSITVICTDKTGTLTMGKMSVDHIVVGEEEFRIASQNSNRNKEEAGEVNLALRIAMMCNSASIENPDEALSDWRFIGPPTETALLSAAFQAGLRKKKLAEKEPRLAQQPFDSDKKFMLSLHSTKDGGCVLYEKGAPEKLLAKSKFFYYQGNLIRLSKEHRAKLKKTYEKMTARGLRVMGVATRNISGRNFVKDNISWDELDRDLDFVAFIAIKDPLRKEAKETIRLTREAGIRPVIITGDHQLTARAIALELGMKIREDNILTGTDLDKISDDKLIKTVSKVIVYARVSPHHKLRIVKALQARGEIVAMTGDGVNDSPAIKAADIGISLGTATDIAKETSDIVLLDDNFKTIISAIKEGRVIFRNIRKVITYLVSDSFSEVILIAGSLAFNTSLAVLPAQILWINIINDGLPDFSLAYEGADKSIMSKAPMPKNEPLLNKEMKQIIFGVGIVRDLIVLAVFLIFYYYWQHDEQLISLLQTIMFATLGIKSLLAIFSLRHFHTPIWKCNPFSNKILLASVLFSFSLLVLAIEWPPLQSLLSTVHLSFGEWMIAFLIGVLGVAMIELIKLRFSRQTI